MKFAAIFKEKYDGLDEQSKRIVREKVDFLELNPYRGERVKNHSFREIHAGKYRLFYTVSEREIIIYFFTIELRTSKTYDQKTLKRVETIERDLKIDQKPLSSKEIFLP